MDRRRAARRPIDQHSQTSGNRGPTVAALSGLQLAEERLTAWVLPDGAVWCQASWMTRDEVLELLVRLRCAPVGRARLRAPHKPLLLLWLFGRFAASGSTVTSYADAEEPVSALINDYGPPVASAAAARRRAAMPFIHLEREIWDLRDASGAEIGPRVPESGSWLTGHGAVGRLRPPRWSSCWGIRRPWPPPQGDCWTCTSRLGPPRVFRTAELSLFHAASCRFRYSSRASCGVRYPSPE